MTAELEVWVARRGDACHVDDGRWLITVFDCHGRPYNWSGRSYEDLPAPSGHWVGRVPPGTYLVRARRDEESDKAATTDVAIADVGCSGSVCVRLFVGHECFEDEDEKRRQDDDVRRRDRQHQAERLKQRQDERAHQRRPLERGGDA